MKLYEVFNTADAVPYEKIIEIRKLIRKGAFDSDITWTNALELVHAAYNTANVERPSPSIHSAWAQYEDNIQYAVTQLADATKKYVRSNDWELTK